VREAIGPPLRAAAAAAFIVGTVLFLVNPPSLSGLEGLLGLIAGAVSLMILTAWATVALTGRSAPSEAEFERVLMRAEELARMPGGGAAETEFDLLVADAIDRLPGEFQRVLDDVPVIVSQRGAELGVYGHYFGDTIARDNHHDRIVLYQDTLERDFGWDPDELTGQVERTLRHELAHHLGWGERGVRDLGL
jgi:predicted Zn-dependent protease with MMP-like domain